MSPASPHCGVAALAVPVPTVARPTNVVSAAAAVSTLRFMDMAVPFVNRSRTRRTAGVLVSGMRALAPVGTASRSRSGPRYRARESPGRDACVRRVAQKPTTDQCLPGCDAGDLCRTVFAWRSTNLPTAIRGDDEKVNTPGRKHQAAGPLRRTARSRRRRRRMASRTHDPVGTGVAGNRADDRVRPGPDRGLSGGSRAEPRPGVGFGRSLRRPGIGVAILGGRWRGARIRLGSPRRIATSVSGADPGRVVRTSDPLGRRSRHRACPAAGTMRRRSMGRPPSTAGRWQANRDVRAGRSGGGSHRAARLKGPMMRPKHGRRPPRLDIALDRRCRRVRRRVLP